MCVCMCVNTWYCVYVCAHVCNGVGKAERNHYTNQRCRQQERWLKFPIENPTEIKQLEMFQKSLASPHVYNAKCDNGQGVIQSMARHL